MIMQSTFMKVITDYNNMSRVTKNVLYLSKIRLVKQ